MIRKNKSLEVLKCKKCKFPNKADALFCKRCGNKLITSGFVERINNRLNIFSVAIGLAVAIIFFFVSSLFYGVFLMSGSINMIIYIALVLVTMTFFGGLIAGNLTGNDMDIGAINGGFLSIIILLNLSFILGIYWFSAIAIAAAFAKVFQGLSGINNVNNTALTPQITSENMIFFIEVISIILLIFAAGYMGGALGAYIRKLMD